MKKIELPILALGSASGTERTKSSFAPTTAASNKPSDSTGKGHSPPAFVPTVAPLPAAVVGAAMLSVDPTGLTNALDGLAIVANQIKARLSNAHCEGFSVELGITGGGEVGFLGNGVKVEAAVVLTLDFKLSTGQTSLTAAKPGTRGPK